jgi:hypothetical protein
MSYVKKMPLNVPKRHTSGHFPQPEKFIFFLPFQHLAETNLIGLDMGHPDGRDCDGHGF